MLLYITAEDVFGDATPRRRGPQPPQGVPETLTALYDRGLRHHLRPAALVWPGQGGFEAVPDWRLDRLVIRMALYCRERLQLEPGTRAAVFGRLGWLWPAVDFAAQGFQATPVGIEHDVPDEALLAALVEADPKLIVASDASSEARLVDLRSRGLLPPVTIVGTGAQGGSLLPIASLLDFAGTLDTAERAQAFRIVARQAAPSQEALWHVSARGCERLSHAAAMQRVAERLRERPAQHGDLAYLQAPRVTLATRLALAAFVGDGLTTAAIGHEGAAGDEVARLRPHGLRVEAGWLEAACAGAGPRWPAGLDRRAARGRLRARLGERLRWVETERAVDATTRAALAATGARLLTESEQ